jgi:hypothetical protein
MKRIIVSLAVLLALVPSLSLTSTVYAAAAPPPSCGTPSDAKTQVLDGIGQTNGNCDGGGVTNAISAAVNILSLIVGVAAIIVIILSGFKYITSGGDTLVYALVGLVVAALAQLLVHFVLAQSNTAILPSCPPDHSIKPPNCRM